MKIVMLGLSITSAWGNGHATTYRALARGLGTRGHDVLFLERDVRWYAKNRDLPAPPYCRVRLYRHLDELRQLHTHAIEDAHLVMVGSYVPQGNAVAEHVLRTAGGCAAFYDIDTPVTLRALEQHGTANYLDRAQVPRFDLYLSFTGGPTLQRLERAFEAIRRKRLPHANLPRQGRTEFLQVRRSLNDSDRLPDGKNSHQRPRRASTWVNQAGRLIGTLKLPKLVETRN